MMYFNYNPYLLYRRKNDIFYYRSGGLIIKGKLGVVSEIIKLGKKAGKKVFGKKKSGETAAAEAVTKVSTEELIRRIKSDIKEIAKSVTKRSSNFSNIKDEATAQAMLRKSSNSKAALDYLKFHTDMKKLNKMSFEDLVKFRAYFGPLLKNIDKGEEALEKINNAMRKAGLKKYSEGIPTTETPKVPETPPKKRSKLKTALKIAIPAAGLSGINTLTNNLLSEKIIYPIGQGLNSLGKGAASIVTNFVKGVAGIDPGEEDSDLVVTSKEQPVSNPTTEQSYDPSTVRQILEMYINENSNP